ncbi:MAG: ribonuclease HIII [candidate division Zixibacteria bacterium]|nr:ribonuclease HIII [candidate division Zixibacteria bacterium]
MAKVEFKYPAEVARRKIEEFAETKCYPFERKVLNNGLLWKYAFTTGEENETVVNVYLKADGTTTSVYVEKGNPVILEELIGDCWKPSREFSVVGIDEAGKGDYFGPLVIAAAGVTPMQEIKLKAAGVADSKNIDDKSVIEIAKRIAVLCSHDVVVIGPEKYNELYSKFGNLNRLLAWGHARALENVLKKGEFKVAISDKFSRKDELRSTLFQKGKEIELIEKPRAEAEVCVATASIIARATFLNRLQKLSKACGVKLPKGATHILDVAKKLVEKVGKEQLGKYAKLHFKTTDKVLG